jgi:hypothetical protein
MRRYFFAILVVGSFLLTGCTFVRVQNVTESNVTVAIRVPDSANTYTKRIPAAYIGDVFSAHGGRYSVTILSEEYRSLLQDFRQIVMARMMNEGATLSAADVQALTQRLGQIDQLLVDLENEADVTCSGSVGDFETAIVTVAYDPVKNTYVISCGG